jgi:hypothetical protein
MTLINKMCILQCFLDGFYCKAQRILFIHLTGAYDSTQLIIASEQLQQSISENVSTLLELRIKERNELINQCFNFAGIHSSLVFHEISVLSVPSVVVFIVTHNAAFPSG